MLDFILSRLDMILYLIIFIGIYVFLLYLWRKIASLETSFYKLDKAFVNIDSLKSHENPEVIKKETSEKNRTDFEKIFNKIKITEIESEDISVDKKDKNEIDEIDEAVIDLLEEDETDSKSSYTKSKLNKMSIENIKDLAKKNKISVEGKKIDIINKIIEIDNV
jgi:hypothetical protein